MRAGIRSAPLGEDAMSVSLTRRSEGLAAQDFNGQSDYADLSSGVGVYIVFSTDAANTFLADSNDVSDIWRQDGQSGALERVSCTLSGEATDGASFSPAISADGRYVAFTSLATNLTINDGNGFADVFRKDMATGAVLIVSAAPDGLPANSVSFAPAISADGRYVTFLSAANNIVDDDTNYSVDVFRKDMLTSTTLRVDLAADGIEASAGAMNAPSISADGRYIAFDSTAANLTGYDSNNRDDVFVKDMLSGAITRASEGANGESLTGEVEGILRPAISADGHYVVFATAAAMLASDSNGVADIYRKDLWTGAIMRVSTDSGENQGDAASFDADISADGRYVSFTSQASNFVAGDGLLSADIFRKDLLTGALLLISRNADGEPAFGQSTHAAISADGATIGFTSTASTLVATDRNFLQDVFSAHIGAPTGVQTGGGENDALYGNTGNDTLLGMGGDDLLSGGDGSDRLEGGMGNDTMQGGPGNDAMIGGTGDDSYEVDSLGDAVIEQEDEGTDTILVLVSGWTMPDNAELGRLSGSGDSLFASYTGQKLVANPLLGSMLSGGAGNDTLQGGAGNDILDGGGGGGGDLAVLSGRLSQHRYGMRDGVLLTSGADGLDRISNMDFLQFEAAAAISIASLKGLAADQGLILVNRGGQNSYELPDLYAGPVSGLQNQLLGSAASEVVLATDRNDFINALGGDDGIDGGAGEDILDGGLGSNFLTGGAGSDTFFIDGRGAHYGASGTWSTIADFTDGEAVTIWGYQPGLSRFTWLASDGANGFKGATLHCDLNGNGLIDTSITCTGLAVADLPKPFFGADYIYFG